MANYVIEYLDPNSGDFYDDDDWEQWRSNTDPVRLLRELVNDVDGQNLEPDYNWRLRIEGADTGADTDVGADTDEPKAVEVYYTPLQGG